MELSDRSGKKTLPTQDFSRPGPGWSRLGLDNPGLEWNLVSGLKAVRENSVNFSLSKIWLLDASKRREKIIPKRHLNKEMQKPRYRFSPGLALIDLRTTRPRWSDYTIISYSEFKSFTILLFLIWLIDTFLHNCEISNYVGLHNQAIKTLSQVVKY